MRPHPAFILTFTALTAALLIPPQYRNKANPPSIQAPLYINHADTRPEPISQFKVDLPTPYESAIQARQILQSERYGVLSTIFPSTTHASTAADDSTDLHAWERRPASVAGLPVGLPEYVADCEGTGDPTLLAIGISTSAKNWAAGSNVSLAITSHDASGRDWMSQAAHPRYTLFGHIEKLTEEEVQEQGVGVCFAKTHPDAIAWYPGNPIHESYWVRLVVEEVYWIGGFGDRAYIGWISKDDWNRAGKHAYIP